MMKQSPITAVLVGIVCISAVLTVVLSVRYYFSAKEMERLRLQYAQITNARAAMQSLAADALEYGQRNPAIDPLLLEFKLKSRPGPITNAPMAKPISK